METNGRDSEMETKGDHCGQPATYRVSEHGWWANASLVCEAHAQQAREAKYQSIESLSAWGFVSECLWPALRENA